MIHRRDLDRAAEAARPLGYQPKKMMGGYALIRPGQHLAEAIRLLERIRNPPNPSRIPKSIPSRSSSWT